MNITEQCIDLLQQNITELAGQAYYNTYGSQNHEESFTHFMENFTQQLEHIVCEFLMTEMFKHTPDRLMNRTGQPFFQDVQTLINKASNSHKFN